MRLILILLAFPILVCGQWPDNYQYGNKSMEYGNLIKEYELLSRQYEEAKLFTIGITDIGKPLHAFIIDAEKNFAPNTLNQRNKPVLLINNGIHPGEPCGIDASLLLAKQMLQRKIAIPNVRIIIIPTFNTGGTLNRGCCSRANQNGPDMYGFRGNAKNLDLNRDFVKMDAKNTRSLIAFIHNYDPDVFIDTHTSNGADYQYVMTLIQSQIDKLHPRIAKIQNDELTPFLYNSMANHNYPMVPYVYTMGKTPETGIKDYLDSPRYSTGYTATRNTLSFVSETHMWKPFEERVKSTYLLLYSAASWMEKNVKNLIQARKDANKDLANQKEVAIDWKLDTTKVDSVLFLGYESSYVPSKLTGLPRLFYDRDKPYQITIPYYHHYSSTKTAVLPNYYIIPQAWSEVVEKLKIAGVEVKQLKEDSKLKVIHTYVSSFETVKNPYEGHYLHYNTEITENKENHTFYKGDYVIVTNQKLNGFIGNVLDASGVDSYFNWGFFDAILQQKEWFSDYVFEEKAIAILDSNPKLKMELDKAVKKDSSLAKSHWQQLYFVYKNSAYYENSAYRYPVFKYNGSLLGNLQ